MSETLQSGNLSPGQPTDIFAEKLADKTVGHCSKEYCSVQRRMR